jgi:ferredoxin
MMQPSSETTSQGPTDPAVQTFEAALDARAQAMADACTRCGKCVEVCPVTAPGGLTAEELKNPAAVIGGVIDIVRTGTGDDAARNGPMPASSPANASRLAITASIRASSCTWRG